MALNLLLPPSQGRRLSEVEQENKLLRQVVEVLMTHNRAFVEQALKGRPHEPTSRLKTVSYITAKQRRFILRLLILKKHYRNKVKKFKAFGKWRRRSLLDTISLTKIIATSTPQRRKRAIEIDLTDVNDKKEKDEDAYCYDMSSMRKRCSQLTKQINVLQDSINKQAQGSNDKDGEEKDEKEIKTFEGNRISPVVRKQLTSQRCEIKELKLQLQTKTKEHQKLSQQYRDLQYHHKEMTKQFHTIRATKTELENSLALLEDTQKGTKSLVTQIQKLRRANDQKQEEITLLRNELKVARDELGRRLSMRKAKASISGPHRGHRRQSTSAVPSNTYDGRSIRVFVRILYFVGKIKYRLRQRKETKAVESVARDGKKLNSALFMREVTSESIKTDIVLNDQGNQSPQILEMLTHALKKIALLGPISRENRRKAAQSMQSLTCKAGDVIIHEGEMGEHAFIIETGIMEVFCKGEKIANVVSGNSFGELALVFGAPRNASVIAKTHARLWALDRKTYRTMVAQSSQHEFDEKIQALTNVSLLKSLSKSEIYKVAEAVEIERFKAGESILEKGKRGDKFYMIKQGTCLVCDVDIGGGSATLTPGTYFGELALLHDEPRAATIVASTPTTCLTLDRQRFIEMLGPLSTILEKRGKASVVENATELHDFASEEKTKVLEAFQEVHLKSGQTLFAKDEKAYMFYVIEKGSIKLEVAGQPQQLSSGQTLGHASLLNRDQYFTKAVAASACTLHQLEVSKLSIPSNAVQAHVQTGLLRQAFNQFSWSVPTSTEFYAALASQTIWKRYTDPALLYAKGDNVEKMYIIGDGYVVKENDQVLLSSSVFPLNLSDKFSAEAEFTMKVQEYAYIGEIDATIYQQALKHEEKAISHPHADPMIDYLAPLPGSSIQMDDLEFHRVIGIGFTGLVKLVVHKETRKKYALKVINKANIETKNQHLAAQSECQMLRRLSHPTIVQLVQTFKDKDNVYLLMEFIPGGELFTLIERSPTGTLSEDHVRFYVSSIVLFLEYLHHRDIAFRDIKPENIAIDADGYPRVVDFGFAKHLKNERTYTLCGTPEFLAPEIILGTGHSKAVDCWSLGILIYDMLFGNTPFADLKTQNQMTMWKKVIKGKVKFPVAPVVGDDVKKLIRQLLAVDPGKRLGCLKAGMHDIKNDPWFEGLDFNAILSKTLPAPWKPETQSVEEATYFTQYDDPGPGEPYNEHDGSGWTNVF